LFVKLYSNKAKYAAEYSALSAIGKRYSWTILPVAGSDSGALAWQSFPFIDLQPIDELAFSFYDWGVRLAELHSCEPPGSLARSQRAIDVVEKRLELLALLREPVAVKSAQDASAIWLRARGTVGDDAQHYQSIPCLISNDFGFRNTFLRPDGQLILIDFERATIGDPHWELGKAWDRELRSVSDREDFLGGYHARLSYRQDWPHRATLWVTRFVACVAAIPYALRVGDQEFLDHSIAVLRELRWEL
jgi:aminoglycoside phosphotransferase (APT) family kinase protein